MKTNPAGSVGPILGFSHALNLFGTKVETLWMHQTDAFGRDFLYHFRVIDYDQARLKEHELKNTAEGAEFKQTKTVTWINVDGLHDLSAMKEIGKTFDLHPLSPEFMVRTLSICPKYILSTPTSSLTIHSHRH